MSQTFRALSLKSLQTTSNASTHTLFLSLGLEPTKIVGYSVQILFKGDKSQGGVFVQTANWIPVLTKFRKAILRIKSFHSVLKLLKYFQDVQIMTGFLPKKTYKTRRVQPSCRLCSLSVIGCSMKHRSSKNVQKYIVYR